MNVFVYECFCGAGLGLGPSREAFSTLVSEGFAMLRALVRDFSRLDEVEELATLVSSELVEPLRAISPKVRAEGVRGRDSREAFRRFDARVESSDRVLVVAPEIDGALLSLSERVVDRGGSLLGCLPAGVRVAGDKLECARRLERASIPTPPVLGWPPGADFDGRVPWTPGYPAVLRPRHGAGSVGTFRVRSRRELGELEAPAGSTDRILSPLVEGMPASASFIITEDSRTIALAPGEQTIERQNGTFVYRGGRLPLSDAGQYRRASELGRRAVDALEGLRGFVGVDLVLASDSRDDVVLEVNPRLTTSYLGLRRLYHPLNLGAWILDIPGVPSGDAPGDLVSRRPVVFDAGEVSGGHGPSDGVGP